MNNYTLPFLLPLPSPAVARCVPIGNRQMAFTLIRPIVAYSKSLRSLTRLPAGAVVEAMEHQPPWKKLGLVAVIWEDQHYFVFVQDLESDGKSGEQQDIGL